MTTRTKLRITAAAVAGLAVSAWIWWAARRPPPGTDRRPAIAAALSGEASPPAVAVASGPTGGSYRAAAARQPPSLARTARGSVPPPPKLLVGAAGAGAARGGPPGEEDGDGGGTLDPDQVVKVIRGVMPGIKKCYETLLEKDPQASGRLVVSFTIVDAGGGTGKVSEASIVPQDRTDAAPELIAPLTEQCVVNAIGEQAFPAPEGGPVEVSFPFVFSANPG
jgi:hypothetical protein